MKSLSTLLACVAVALVVTAAASGGQSLPVHATVHLANFRSPTGNIGCVMLFGNARCDVAKRTWRPPARPAKCPNIVDYGQGLQVGGSGKGSFVCAGDTALDPTGTPLAYGTASVRGRLECVSEVDGMTCLNLRNRHGFFISRTRYRIF